MIVRSLARPFARSPALARSLVPRTHITTRKKFLYFILLVFIVLTRYDILAAAYYLQSNRVMTRIHFVGVYLMTLFCTRSIWFFLRGNWRQRKKIQDYIV